MTPYVPAELPPDAAVGPAIIPATRIPRAAQARLLLHDQATDPPFMAMLQDVLPDEAARLAYLNHLAWQGRS